MEFIRAGVFHCIAFRRVQAEGRIEVEGLASSTRSREEMAGRPCHALRGEANLDPDRKFGFVTRVTR